jgi:hypothetical protein
MIIIKLKIDGDFFEVIKDYEFDICKQLKLTLPEFYKKIETGELNIFELTTVLHYIGMDFNSFVNYYGLYD